MTQTQTSTRRGFLGFLAVLVGSVPVLGALLVSSRAGLAPAHADRPRRRRLCRLDAVPADDILVCPVSYQMRRGPAVEDVAQIVLVTRDPEDPTKIIAMSGECTHLACPVQKKTVTVSKTSEVAPLRCPCHGGVFSRTGEVVDGPPPEPLRRLQIELPEDGAGMIMLVES